MVERIRTLLESRQLTPTQFADLIGVARPIISHVLSGRNKPSLEVVQRILAAMPDLSMAWLLNGTKPMLTSAREITLTTSAPRLPEAGGTPLPANPALPVEPAQLPGLTTPAPSVVDNQNIDAQVDSSKQGVAKARPFPAVTPALPGVTALGTSVVATGAPVASPPSPAGGRPAMPRRFTARLPAAGQPESVAAPGQLLPVAPLPPALPARPAPGTGPALPAAAVPKTTILQGAKPVENESTAVNYTVIAGPAAPVSAPPPAVPDAAAPGTAGLAAGDVAGGVPGSAPILGTILAPGEPTLATRAAAALLAGAEKPIRRIVIFYRDGSFADYQPEEVH